MKGRTRGRSTPVEARRSSFWGSGEAEVLEQEGLAGFELFGHLGGYGADAVGREGDIFSGAEHVVEEGAQGIDQRAETEAIDRLAFGAAEVRGEDDFGLVAEAVLDGRDGLDDAGVVEDDAIFQRDVEVDAEEYALVGQVEVTE